MILGDRQKSSGYEIEHEAVVFGQGWLIETDTVDAVAV
jgi:hypothetical protein